MPDSAGVQQRENGIEQRELQRESPPFLTDVERQPYRSMGFVSVNIVSGLFALGLPLVLL